MSGRRYTIAEKIEICEEAIAKEKEGVSLHKHSQSLDIADVTLYTWVNEYNAGTLIDIPAQLISDMSDELNKKETIDVLVFSGSPENSIMITVDKPKTSIVGDYIDEMDRLVFNKLRWCPIMNKS